MTCVVEKNLLGGCKEFAEKQIEEKGGEFVSVYEDGYPFHVAVRLPSGNYIDATGEWEDINEWLTDLRKAMRAIDEDGNEWDGAFYVYNGIANELV